MPCLGGENVFHQTFIENWKTQITAAAEDLSKISLSSDKRIEPGDDYHSKTMQAVSAKKWLWFLSVVLPFFASSILFDLFYGGPGFVRASKDEIDNYLTTKNTGCQNKADTNKTKHRCHNGWLSDGKYRWDGTWTAQAKKKQCIRNNSLSDVRLCCGKNCFKNSCSNLKASI